MKIINEKMKPTAYIKSRNKNNHDIVDFIGFETDENNNVYLLVVYKKNRRKVIINNTVSDKYDCKIKIGERYIVLDNHVYFIDDIDDKES